MADFELITSSATRREALSLPLAALANLMGGKVHKYIQDINTLRKARSVLHTSNREPIQACWKNHCANARCQRLALGKNFVAEADLKTFSPQDDLIFFGGPVANPYSRVILGMGRGSPLLQVVPGQSGVLPVMFDLEATIKSNRLASYSGVHSVTELDWDVVVNGRTISRAHDFLLITSVPNVFRQAGRLVVVSGKHGGGTRAIDLLLQQARMLERILESIRNQGWDSWQVLIPVAVDKKGTPLALSEPAEYPIKVDFGKKTPPRKTLLQRP